MMQKNKSITINDQLKEQEFALYKTGALFEALNGSCAVAIIQGQLAISDKKAGDDWDWTTIMNGGQVIVGEVFTGTLHTDNVTVQSANGKLCIKDSIISIKDQSESVLKWDIKMGNMYLLCMQRTEKHRHGIQSYNAAGQADGLYANSSFDNNTDIHQIALYDNGEALFKVFKGSMGTHMSLDGSIFLTCKGNEVRFGKTLMYNGAEIATKKDIENLQNQINALKGV